jgi:hypothetical protein
VSNVEHELDSEASVERDKSMGKKATCRFPSVAVGMLD